MSAAASILDDFPSVQLSNMGLRVDGVPFSLKRYPYIKELIDGPNGCRVRERTVIKGAQMGFTVAEILKCLEDGISLPLRGIGYYFPTDSDAQSFAKARWDSITDNPGFVHHLGHTDSASLKQIAGTWFYFRGAGAKGTSSKANMSPIKSIPLDVVVLDESDEMQSSRKDAIEMRLSGSLAPELRRLSTPTLPGYGVDLDYKRSDERTWHWKCPACNDWTCLELTFPDCIAEPAGKEPYYLCAKCREPLKKGKAEWVAKYPDRLGDLVSTPSGPTYTGHAGYWVSQLCSPTRTAQQVILEQEKAQRSGRMREFWNQVMARSFAELEDMLTREQIAACVTETPRAVRDAGPCVMGVDPGKQKSWWIVKVRESEKATRTLAYGWAAEFSELAQIAKAFNVECGVMDGMAETHAVRAFVKDHPGWWMARYVGQRKGTYDWDPVTRTVTACRTEVLDASHDKFISGNEKLPAPDERYNEELVPQLLNMARLRKENELTGDVKMEWVVVGGQKNDHLKHAHGYATMAEERVGLAKDIAQLKRRSRHQDGRKRRSFMSA